MLREPQKQSVSALDFASECFLRRVHLVQSIRAVSLTCCALMPGVCLQELHRQYVLRISEETDTFEFCMTEVRLRDGYARWGAFCLPQVFIYYTHKQGRTDRGCPQSIDRHPSSGTAPVPTTCCCATAPNERNASLVCSNLATDRPTGTYSSTLFSSLPLAVRVSPVSPVTYRRWMR